MAGWCSVTVTFGGTGYSQNYKRHIPVHSHAQEGAFVVAAKQDALTRINNARPATIPNPVTINQLNTGVLKVEQGNDPGPFHRAI